MMIVRKKNISFSIDIFIVLLLLILFLIPEGIIAQDTIGVKNHKQASKFRDSKDGAIDISLFLDDPAGFVLFPIIITEPAIGYGGGLGIIFINDKKKNTANRKMPMISGAFGAYTANHTWFTGIFHFNNWKNDRIRYAGIVSKLNVNMKYYGNNFDFLSKNPVKFNMNAWFVMQRLQFRINESNLFIGGQYNFYHTKNAVDTLPNRPLINRFLKKLSSTSVVSMLILIVNYDNRNNIFTPTKGMNTGFQVSYNSPFLGGSEEYWRSNLYYMGYFPISKRIFSAWRFDYQLGFGEIPFYAQPFVQLRGAPAMRYQSKNTMLVETDWLFNVRKRWFVNLFTGVGDAFNEFSEFGNSTHVISYGFGIRYKIAERHGILAGIDFAWTSDKDFAFYLVFGSPWRK